MKANTNHRHLLQKNDARSAGRWALDLQTWWQVSWIYVVEYLVTNYIVKPCKRILHFYSSSKAKLFFQPASHFSHSSVTPKKERKKERNVFRLHLNSVARFYPDSCSILLHIHFRRSGLRRCRTIFFWLGTFSFASTEEGFLWLGHEPPPRYKNTIPGRPK